MTEPADHPPEHARAGRESFFLGLAGLVLGGLSSSIVPLVTQFAARSGIPATSTAFWRVAFGAVLMFAASAWPLASGQRPGRSVVRPTLVLGVIFAIQIITWFKSVLVVGAGIATVLANTAIFWMVPLGWLLFRERPSLQQVGAIVLAFIGVVLLVDSRTAVSTTVPYSVGVLLGLCTGLSYAIYLATLRHTGASLSSLPTSAAFRILGWSQIISAAGIGSLALAEGTSLMPPDLASLGLLFTNAFAGQLASVVIFLSLPRVAAVVASLVLLLQPTLATIWGSAILDERLSNSQMLGVAMVLISVSLGAYVSASRRGARRA